MILLRPGDKYATVGMAQRVINMARVEHAKLNEVAELEEDGIYGRNTRKAVVEIQKVFSLRPDGILGPDVWSKLAEIVKCRIVDVMDLVLEAEMNRHGVAGMRERMAGVRRHDDPKASHKEVERYVDSCMRKFNHEITGMRGQHDRPVAAGARTIGLTDFKHTYDTIRRGLEAESRNGWHVALLRLQGHGHAGSQGVAGSLWVKRSIDRDALSFDDHDTVKEHVRTVTIGGMTNPMPQWGVVELHGCKIGDTSRLRNGTIDPKRNGPAFMQEFVDTVYRPATTSKVTNLFGDIWSDVRIEGPLVSCVPGGGSVKQWYKSVL